MYFTYKAGNKFELLAESAVISKISPSDVELFLIENVELKLITLLFVWIYPSSTFPCVFFYWHEVLVACAN